ncbi:RagB/SusD family nutrient uptake outer membrane protein [Sphingobacterium oryzagri]|uniref:RagB/SusD family nutrient uptake outer membrane protein n=1 Tax=Sphingobacterium oryzagri TaxID=3025669 RepID=A0ABY7WMI9_9SPHI|nr:RagB/SusD family nutrient uptake outer membrane protein [Sphingobacterium sp. KACC 22765]WDF69626.1 RagB/SusD family nutrient uptake outer membrane protein [Sphingobacterium sp. KACC 22765]
MKTKKIICRITTFASLCMALLFSACEKQLENVLINDTYSNVYWKSQSDVEAALNGTYSLFRRSLTTNQAFFVWGDLPIGKLITNDNTNQSGIYSGNFTTPYREDGVHNWTNWYRIVNLANLLIKKIPDIPESAFVEGQKKQLLGQAYFMRSLSYFYMTRVWGDVPLQIEPVETAEDAVIKGTTASSEILDLVIQDAQKASSLMSWESVEQSGRRRANKGAALALLAHATAFQNDYAKTIVYSDSLINQSGLYALQTGGTVKDLFKTATARENIFVVTAKDAENESSGNTGNLSTNSIMFITLSNIRYTGFPMATPLYFTDATRYNSLYDAPADLRRNDFFEQFDAGPVNADNAQGVNRYSLIKYANFVYRNAATFSDVRAESNIIIFRLADIMLLKAEALNYLNRDGEARAAVNTVRARSNAPALHSTLSGTALLTEILKERQRELIGEGHAYFDIVRNIWKRSGSADFRFNPSALLPWSLGGTNTNEDRFALKGYRFPIHNIALNANKEITQIPYWMGRY